MPEKHRDIHRLSAAIASGFLLMAVSFWAGCDGAVPASKTAPPVPHKLTDTAIRGSGDAVTRTPTAMVSPEIDRPEGRADDTTGRDKTGPDTAPPAAKKDREKTAEKPTGEGTAPAIRGEFTIQIGAYIIDENLTLVKEKVTSLGFTPYTVDIGRKMKLFCVIVGEARTEEQARDIVSALSEKGFGTRLLPRDGNMVDVAGGIYYYKDDASEVEGRIRSLGYAVRVEERMVEVILKCLRIGSYGTADEAAKDLNALKQNGFSPVILKSDQ
jgi:hypothetical protein